MTASWWRRNNRACTKRADIRVCPKCLRYICKVSPKIFADFLSFFGWKLIFTNSTLCCIRHFVIRHFVIFDTLLRSTLCKFDTLLFDTLLIRHFVIRHFVIRHFVFQHFVPTPFAYFTEHKTWNFVEIKERSKGWDLHPEHSLASVSSFHFRPLWRAKSTFNRISKLF